MLEMLELDIDNAVAFRIAGKVTDAEMSCVLDAARLKRQQHDKIVFLEQIDSFKGIELAAIITEFKYVFEIGFSHVSKVAVVSDKQWLKNIACIEDKLFRSIDIRCFASEDRELALAFLKTA